MSWSALDIRATEPARPSVAAWLVRRTGQAVEEREGGLLVGVAPAEAAGAILDELRGAFGAVVAGGARPLPDQDWDAVWKQGLGPRRIGRLLVTPSWIAPQPGDGFTVVIDPETAFGTGEHGSTRGTLLLLDRWLRPDTRVIDLGSGSGILTIAAVKLGARLAIGIDIDPEAELVASANAERNGVASRARFLTGDAALLTGLLGPADLVLSNILRSQNETLLPAIRSILPVEGMAVFSGMESDEAPEFRAGLQRGGFVAVDETEDEGWWSVAVRAR
jgi:ribosomal protein L11 methyltransferase